MKRKEKRLWSLMLLAMLLCLCGTAVGQVFPEQTQFLGPTPTPTQVPVAQPQTGGESIFSANPYNVDTSAMEEETYVDPYDDVNAATQTGTTVYPYAGTTPIPLDPIDMPSPTPRPELAFTYVSYTAGSLGLTFEAPAGWMIDDSMSDVYTLTEPAEQMHDGQQCVITLSAVPVNSNYSERELKSQVSQRLKDISAVNFSVWDPSLTATRYLMGSKGVYANYTGKRADGVELGGRIHYTSLNNMLYGVEIVFPRGYREDFLSVFSHIRETIVAQ